MENTVNNSRLFIRGFPNHKLKDDVWRELGRVGMKNMVEVSMYKHQFRGAKNSGYALVEFISRRHAEVALEKYAKKLTLWGVHVGIGWPLLSDGYEGDVRVLHLQNLEWRQSSDELRHIVEKIVGPGSVESVVKIKNYAFVHMATRELAEEAMLGLKDYYNYSLIEVQWARTQNGNFRHGNTYKPNRIKRSNGSTESRSSSFSPKSTSPSTSPEPPETSTTRSISDLSFGSSCEELERLFEVNETRRIMENASLREIMFGNKKSSASRRDNRRMKPVESESPQQKTIPAATTAETTHREEIAHPRLFDQKDMGQFSIVLPTKEYAENYGHSCKYAMPMVRKESPEHRQPWRVPTPTDPTLTTSFDEMHLARQREKKQTFHSKDGKSYDPIQYYQKQMDLLYGLMKVSY